MKKLLTQKKLFTLLLVVLLTTSAAWGNNVFVKVTSEDQLQAGKRYILAREYPDPNNQNNKESVAGKMPTGSNGGTITQKSKNYYTDNSYIDNRIDIDNATFKDNVTEFELGGDAESGWTFYVAKSTLNANSGYLTLSDYKEGIYGYVKVLTNLSDKARWDLENIEGEDGLCVINHSNKNHIIMQQADNKPFGAYNITRTNSSGALMYQSYYKAYLFVELGAPVLKVSAKDIALGKQSSGSFIVKGKDLVDDVTISVEGTEGFSVSPETLSAAEVNVADLNTGEGGKEVTVTYNGTAHEASATITVSCGELTEIIHVTAESSAEWTTIYIPKTAGDYYIWAWDANGTIPGEQHNYFDSWPGKKINELETANLGNNGGNIAGVEFYKFEFGDNATGLGLVFTEGADGPKTATITPKDHEIYYYAGGTECPTGIPMDNVIFPDETFLKFIKSTHFKSKSGEKYDQPYEYNGYPNVTYILEPEELASIDFMNINDQLIGDIYSFKGLEYFTNLKEVKLIEGGNFHVAVSELDLSMSPSLEILHVNGAGNLTSLKLPEGTLKELELSHCKALPVSDLNQKLATYENLEILTLDYCTQIDALNVDQNKKLTHLKLSAVPIPSLNLLNNSELISLHLSGTLIGSDNLNQNIAEHKKLQELYLSSNEQLTATTIDLSQHTDLTNLQVHNQKCFTEFNLTNNKKINYLVLSENGNLSTLTMPSDAMQHIEHLWIEKNRKLMLDAIDLTGNTSLKQISVNFNGKASTITGVGKQMTDLRYISTEGQRYYGNVLDLEGLQEFYHLDVLNCGLDKLNVKNCKALGDVYYREQETENTTLIERNSNTQISIEGNYLRSLDFTGTFLPYNYNVTGSEQPVYDSTGEIIDYKIQDNPLFSPVNYMRHYSYNRQIPETITPSVALVYHDRWNTKTYTYLVYVRLDKNNDDYNPQTNSPVQTLNELFNFKASERGGGSLVDVGFDYNRVKLWSRFLVSAEGDVVSSIGTDDIQVIEGVASQEEQVSTDVSDLSTVNPSSVLGNILSLGLFTIECGHTPQQHSESDYDLPPVDSKSATISGKVSYMYDTNGGQQNSGAKAPGVNQGVDVENGDPVDGSEAENNYYKSVTVQNDAVVEKYDNTFPVEFNWSIDLTNYPQQIITAIEGIHGDLPALVEEIQYYNVMGQMSHKPFDGVNIVLTRYSNGTVITSKVIR